jgi:hypothetical protein
LTTWVTHIISRFVAAPFRGIFWILCKLMPILLEPMWFCTLVVIRQAPGFLQKKNLDPQDVISSLNFDH